MSFAHWYLSSPVDALKPICSILNSSLRCNRSEPTTENGVKERKWHALLVVRTASEMIQIETHCILASLSTRYQSTQMCIWCALTSMPSCTSETLQCGPNTIPADRKALSFSLPTKSLLVAVRNIDRGLPSLQSAHNRPNLVLQIVRHRTVVSECHFDSSSCVNVTCRGRFSVQVGKH